MLALDLLSCYLHDHPYGVSDAYATQLRYTWGAYTRESGRSGLDALDADSVNSWLDSLRRTHRPDSCRTQRGNVLVLWWYAYRQGLVSEPPLRVRRLRPIRRQPVAWTVDEVRQLVETAEQWPSRPWWWSSLIRVGYDTALRLSDLLGLRTDQIAASMTVEQSKTQRQVAVRLREETLAVVRRHLREQGPSRLVWPLWAGREAMYRAFARIVVRAGIRPGTFRWLRRTAITQVERIEPGRGTQLAGHCSRSTTETWYIDRGQLEAPPLPPM